MEEMFTVGGGERQLVSGVEVTPFPDPEPSTGLLAYHQQQPAEPPQKLRPIRPNGGQRNPANPTPTTSAGQVFSSPELGFLLPDHWQPVAAADLVRMKSEMDSNFISSLKSQISSQLHLSFSSSSDGSGDSGATKPKDSEKPKRKKRKKMECYLQNLMGQVIERQEQMHTQLMEMIESKERERAAREEAWRRQEMERANKQDQIRSQETARSLALVSLIQKALLPHSLSPQVEDERRQQGNFDPTYKRWLTSEVQALITLRTALHHDFTTFAPNAPVWERVSAAMASMGYIRNAKICKNKWENINKYFNKVSGSGKQPSENTTTKSCPYFHELQTLYRNQLITTTKANSPTHEDAVHNWKQIQ